jgi:hypothetical protein
MVTRTSAEHTLLESEETRILIEYGDDGHARLDVMAKQYGRGSAAAGRLAREAIHQARLRHADSIEGALDASSPMCGAILEALHREIGHDLESIAMRRAGASVMVTLEMRATPTTPSSPHGAHTSVIPAQPRRLHRTTPAARPSHVG